NRSGAESVAAWPIEDRLHRQRLRIDLDDRRRLPGALPGREDRAVARPADVVDAEAEGDLVARRRCLAAREPEKRLAAPRRHVKRLAVGRHLETVGAGGLAARHFLPARRGVPFPELAILLAGHHPLRRRRRASAGKKVAGDEPTVGQPANRVQADRIGGHRAPEPRQDGRLRARVELEHFDRLSPAVPDDEETMHVAAARHERKTVRRESGRIRRSRTRTVGLLVEAILRRRGRIRLDRRPVTDANQVESAAAAEDARDDPRIARDDDEILRTLLPADEFHIGTVHTGRWRPRLRRWLGRGKRHGQERGQGCEKGEAFHDSSLSITAFDVASISSIFSGCLPPASAKSGRPPPAPPTIDAISFTICPALIFDVRSGVTATTI